MNYFKLALLLGASSFLVTINQAQSSGKIGAGFTSDPLNVLTIDCARVKESGNALNFRLSYGEESQFRDFSRQIVLSDVPEENPYLSEKNLSTYTSRIKLAIGPEFQIKDTKFSWGIEGIAGVGFYDETLAERWLQADENGVINEQSEFSPPLANLDSFENIDRVLFSPGIQGRFSFNTQFAERLGLQLFISSSIEQDIVADTQVKSTSEISELSAEKYSNTNLNVRLGAVFFFKRMKV